MIMSRGTPVIAAPLDRERHRTTRAPPACGGHLTGDLCAAVGARPGAPSDET